MHIQNILSNHIKDANSYLLIHYVWIFINCFLPILFMLDWQICITLSLLVYVKTVQDIVFFFLH